MFVHINTALWKKTTFFLFWSKGRVPELRQFIGIFVPANNRAGPQRMAAVSARLLAMHGESVIIFVPFLPYSFWWLKLSFHPLRWASMAKRSIQARRTWSSFAFESEFDELPPETRSRIVVQTVVRRPSRLRLQSAAVVICYSVAQIYELRSRIADSRIVYLCQHPEQKTHPHHSTEIEGLVASFEGRVAAISPWTAANLSPQRRDVAVVPLPVSMSFAIRARLGPSSVAVKPIRRDVLFHSSSGPHRGGDYGQALVAEIVRRRPETTVTVWNRDDPNTMTELELSDAYAGHKVLIFPSVMEGYGLPPVEAGAIGCIPVLRMNVGASDLYARPNRNCIAITGSIAADAHEVSSLLDDEERLKAFARRISTSIQNTASESVFAEKLFSLLEV